MHQLVSPCTIQVTSKIFKFGRNRSKARDPLDSGGANCFFARQSSVAFSKEDARRGREVTIDETNPNPNPNLNPNPDPNPNPNPNPNPSPNPNPNNNLNPNPDPNPDSLTLTRPLRV